MGSSISLSWSVPNGSVVTSYEVMWISNDCLEDEGSANSLIDAKDNATTLGTSYIIDLRPGNVYYITVSATNSAGTSSSDRATAKTDELGEYYAQLWQPH